MRSLIAVVLIACGSGTPTSSQQQQSHPPPPVVATVPADAAEEVAPIPYTAAQLRQANPAGTVIQFRVEEAGKQATLQTITFVSVDDQGAELEVASHDEHGGPVGTPARNRAAWEELRQHAAFPRSATAISDGVAETPAGRFAAKVYVVTKGDTVTTYYFANERPGPPVLFFSERGGQRVMTSALLPAPVACTSDDDCWLDDERRPIARPQAERGKVVKPCKDGSRVPACKQSVCTVVAYKC